MVKKPISFRTTILIVSLVLIMSSCESEKTTLPSTTVSLRECLVNPSYFPLGWLVAFGPEAYGLPGQVLPGRAEGGITISFDHNGSNALADHEVLAYRTERRAAKEFNRQRPETYFSASRLTPWKTPDSFSYVSPVADQFRLACAEIDGHAQVFNLCIAMGQYGTHLSTFATWVSPDYMTYADLEHILAPIDEHMASCAGMPVTDSPATR